MTDETTTTSSDGKGTPPTTVETPNRDRLARAVTNGTSLFTLAVKVLGLGIAAREAFFVPPPRDAVVLALAAFMMAGAQGLEHFVGNILGKK
jgi:hypothetical protein